MHRTKAERTHVTDRSLIFRLRKRMATNEKIICTVESHSVLTIWYMYEHTYVQGIATYISPTESTRTSHLCSCHHVKHTNVGLVPIKVALTERDHQCLIQEYNNARSNHSMYVRTYVCKCMYSTYLHGHLVEHGYSEHSKQDNSFLLNEVYSTQNSRKDPIIQEYELVSLETPTVSAYCTTVKPPISYEVPVLIEGIRSKRGKRI